MKDSPQPEIFTIRRIAIIEGDRHAAEMLHTFFRLMELEPSLIEPDPAALPTLRRLRPDILLLDLDLPDLRALDIAREIGFPVRIIYLSARGGGFPKPSSFEDLLTLFEHVLET
jgi:DNA-binding response OmpR family regulator